MNKSKIKKFIPENSSPMQEKFINCLMKDGKKSIARKIFDDTLKIVSKKSSTDPDKISKVKKNWRSSLSSSKRSTPRPTTNSSIQMDSISRQIKKRKLNVK